MRGLKTPKLLLYPISNHSVCIEHSRIINFMQIRGKIIIANVKFNYVLLGVTSVLPVIIANVNLIVFHKCVICDNI